MKDRRRIVDLYSRGNAAALVTLIRVEGSSYRRTGARLLITQDGEYAGAISGGCLEAEVIRKAQWLVRDGALVQRYSTLFDDTADIPYGLGCGGTVDLLIEPANTPECAALMVAMQASLRGDRFHIRTHLPSATSPLSREVSKRLDAHEPGAPRLASETRVKPQASCPTFDELLEPPQRLLIFGAGDDAQPLVRLAALMGWRVTVVDARPQWARPDRFPEAEAVHALHAADWTPSVHPQDAVVLMTHSYEQDRAWLAAVLPRSPRYLGLLGARHRSALLVSEAAQILNWPLDHACNGLFAPVGLDLGGDGAEAVALATIAEVQACCEGKLGHSRRMTPEIVAEQIQQGGASRYLQTQCAL